MFATIDIGNTLAKLGLFKDDELIAQFSFQNLAEMKETLTSYSIDKYIIASVNQPYEEISLQLSLNSDQAMFLDQQTNIPFINKYKSSTLGIDRIALVAGAQSKFPQKNVLVIDAGSCITYDFITDKSAYLGGAISPGAQMRFKSMHNFTARLPLLQLKNQPADEWLGNTTEASMSSGVINGIVGEMEAFIRKYQESFGPTHVLISGGDAKFFESRIKATIFAIPELLLVGLNAILRHNASY
ncbi:type III pantothenate kinase [Marivirga atlantica]|uniref:Type III pantothenate kinase n=1 Tax=Marivirga atlantica TaxID=1548457 RepID=A0A937DFQ5_9BACT|nr:type III pantothenate kinase [Marivirga atlantica]MBL0763953.1 type III pantothenate kinase [Marivirga atlantica]